MTAIENQLKSIEAQWFEVTSAAIVRTANANPNEHFYAAGFWLFYVDYTVIGAPCFAMNHETHVANYEYGDGGSLVPPNWQFDVIDGSTDAMSPLYQALSEELAGKDDTVWDAIAEEHKQAIGRLCQLITTAVRNRVEPFTNLNLQPHFVCGIFEERDGGEEFNRLVTLSIEAQDVAKLGIQLSN